MTPRTPAEPPVRPEPTATDGLLAAHVDGDPEAFGTLFGRHRDRLWAVALRTTGNPEDAADALQDAMISAFRRAETFRGDAQVTTWLHRIVVNACLDRIRRAKVRAVQSLPDDMEEYAARGDVLAADADAEPEAVAERSDLRRQLLAALDELPPDQKAALVLVDMQGYARRGGGADPRVPHRHRQEPLLPGPQPAGGAAAAPGARRRNLRPPRRRARVRRTAAHPPAEPIHRARRPMRSPRTPHPPAPRR